MKNIIRENRISELESIRLFQDKDAYDLLIDDNFLEDWKRLLKSQHLNVSVFQTIEFIKSWYLCQRKAFVPLIIIEYQDNIICGLLFLTYQRDKSEKIKRIIAAGEYDAEYQCWLAEPGLHHFFLENALKLINKKFPGCYVVFRFLQHHYLLEMVCENKYLSQTGVTQSFQRPIMDLHSEDFLKIIKKRHLKAKYNRMNRAGKLVLEEIKDLNHFISIYPKIMELYDFRQGALLDKSPSEKYSCEIPLFIRLFKEKVLHVSILTLDGEITSCIIGYFSGDWFHLAGMITYSPFYSRFSPGLVHLFLLCQVLKEKKVSFFDLTPGYDGYKESFKTHSDEVYGITFSQDPIYLARKKIKIKLNQLLLNQGIRPMDFELQARKTKYLWLHKFEFIKNSLLNFSSNNQEVDLKDVPFQKNQISTLLQFKSDTIQSRWEFLSMAFKNVESGYDFYTLSKNGRLMACIWNHPTSEMIGEDKNQEGKNSVKSNPKNYWHKTIRENKVELYNKFIQTSEQL
jgi:hypothetical protein